MTTRSYDLILPPGTHASLPASAPRGTLRPCTTDGKIHQWDGTAWTDWRGSPSFATLSDVDLTGLANGNVPVYDSTAGKWKPGTGGAGSSPRTKITDTVLGSAASTITFSSIPSTYDDLEVVLVGKHSAATISANVVLNSDTTATNYKREILFGTTGTPSAGSSNSNAAMAIALTESRSVLTLTGYKLTTRFKTVSVRSDCPEDFGLYLYGMTWMNNAAVTSVSLQCPSGSFAAGTWARLYGLKDI